MIGNDVVDLSCAKHDSNWKRKGYLSKIYTSSEQLLISDASNSDIMVWILWTMKESSYKANQRITGIKEYAPIKIKCLITKVVNNTYWGTTQYNDLKYYTKTVVCQDYIHSVALFNSTDFSRVEEIFITNYPLNYLEYLQKNNFLNFSDSIVKDKLGIPSLVNKVKKENKPISISHHGNFLFLAFNKD